MPRKRADFLFIVFLIICLGATVYNNCSADVRDGSNPDSVIAEAIEPDSTQKIDQPLPAQSIDSVDLKAADSVILDPVLYHPGKDLKLMNLYKSDDTAVAPTGSPTLTMFKSVVFPGWGQFSNRKYVKAGAIFLIETYFIYKAIDYGKEASDWRTKWQEAPDELKNEYFDKYADNRDRRNTNLWYTALTVFLSMFDAYVDAHLRNFPDIEKSKSTLTVDMSPDEKMGLTLKYNF